MRAYIAITGALYALIVVAHIIRFAMEGGHVLTEPVFVVATFIALFMAGWSWRLFRGGSIEDAGSAGSRSLSA